MFKFLKALFKTSPVVEEIVEVTPKVKVPKVKVPKVKVPKEVVISNSHGKHAVQSTAKVKVPKVKAPKVAAATTNVVELAPVAKKRGRPAKLKS